MDLTYPIQAILIYLSLLFAPAEAERVVFSGPDRTGVLIRDASGWNLVGKGEPVSQKFDGTRLVSGTEKVDLSGFVGNVAGHDWKKEPELELPAGPAGETLSLEVTPDGLKVRNNRGREGIYLYSISFIPSSSPVGPACNVLGAVKQPGIIALRDGDTMRSVLLKAGGPVGRITPHRVFLLGGKPGEAISHREGFDLAALLEGRTGNPPVGDRDTLYVEPSVLLELARDGSLAVDGEPCPAAELSARLRDRVEAGVCSATLHAHRDTPHAGIQPLFDACILAGIPADRLKLDTAASVEQE